MPDIGTLKKYRGDVFSECCAESNKVKFLRFVYELLSVMVKTTLNVTYLGVTITTDLQNEVSTYRKIYYDRETQLKVNQSVNDFTPGSSLKLMHSHRMLHSQWTFLKHSSTIWVPTLDISWFQKGFRFPQFHQLKKITRETRGSFWSGMR